MVEPTNTNEQSDREFDLTIKLDDPTAWDGFAQMHERAKEWADEIAPWIERVAKLRAALEAYPEWMDDDNGESVGTMQRFVTCIVCEGGGAFNGDGKPSKRYPPTHKPDCARQSALNPDARQEGENE